MTLVAAFRGRDGGVLLCADREESENYAKRDVDKIYEIPMLPIQIYLAGAGPSAPIARANMEIHNALSAAFRTAWSVARIPEYHRNCPSVCP